MDVNYRENNLFRNIGTLSDIILSFHSSWTRGLSDMSVEDLSPCQKQSEPRSSIEANSRAQRIEVPTGVKEVDIRTSWLDKQLDISGWWSNGGHRLSLVCHCLRPLNTWLSPKLSDVRVV